MINYKKNKLLQMMILNLIISCNSLINSNICNATDRDNEYNNAVTENMDKYNKNDDIFSFGTVLYDIMVNTPEKPLAELIEDENDEVKHIPGYYLNRDTLKTFVRSYIVEDKDNKDMMSIEDESEKTYLTELYTDWILNPNQEYQIQEKYVIGKCFDCPFEGHRNYLYPLEFAYSKGYYKLTKALLLIGGADVNVKVDLPYTELVNKTLFNEIIKYGDAKTIGFLIKYTPESSFKDESENLFSIAITNSNSSIIETILKKLPEEKLKKVINIRDIELNTGLNLSLLSNKHDSAMAFLKYGADPFIKNEDGEIAIHMNRYGVASPILLEELLKYGVSKNKEMLKYKDNNGNTLLHSLLSSLCGYQIMVDENYQYMYESKLKTLYFLLNDKLVTGRNSQAIHIKNKKGQTPHELFIYNFDQNIFKDQIFTRESNAEDPESIIYIDRRGKKIETRFNEIIELLEMTSLRDLTKIPLKKIPLKKDK